VISTAPRTLASIQIDGARTRAWMFCSVTSSTAQVSSRPIAASTRCDVGLVLGVDVDDVELGADRRGDRRRGLAGHPAAMLGRLVRAGEQRPDGLAGAATGFDRGVQPAARGELLAHAAGPELDERELHGERDEHGARRRVGAAGQRHHVALGAALAKVVPQAERDGARELLLAHARAVLPRRLGDGNRLRAQRRPEEAARDDQRLGVVPRLEPAAPPCSRRLASRSTTADVSSTS